MVVVQLQQLEQFPQQIALAGTTKVVFVDFFATWCGPCRTIAPEYERLSNEHADKAIFLKVDTDKLEELAAANQVTAMPTFICFKNGTKVDMLRGANPTALAALVKKWTDTIVADAGDGKVGGVALPKGQVDLNSMIDKSGSECLNESDEHTLEHAMNYGGGYLESDCDEQLIITLAFSQNVKLHSLKICADGPKAPKRIRIFNNLPHSPDFDSAEGMQAVQEFDLTPEDMGDDGIITLKYVKYQNISKVTIFVKDNQGGEETTQIDHLCFIGTPVSTTNMGDFKRIAGKAGESHG